ncbi:glycosyltransferase [Actinomadura spongiicola]|uniref:Glycosyltransferase n=1 Tax=Actinomadura spongiicola TaxID=2303421 RepID=A0A372GFK8_9ACTN|nr:TIGR04282 family arsenosugar biosynthesis glycosyltransferase [Actinomadura spongiicola]RFS83869.1 glycosyltransferase [Actinomadura spongiicola]
MSAAADPAAEFPGGGPADLIVIAKEPVPGRVKTRLTPAYTPAEAAALAEAALRDTLAAVAATPAGRRTLALDGAPGPWLPAGFAVTAQRGGGLDERLAHAFTDAWAGRPLVLIGMDTPQVTPALLTRAHRALRRHDAVFGPATDGGFWLLGLRRPDARLLRGVPMSRPDTGGALLARLRAAGLDVGELPALTDVDTPADAASVAAALTRGGRPWSRFAAAVHALRPDPATRADRAFSA